MRGGGGGRGGGGLRGVACWLILLSKTVSPFNAELLS